MYGNHPNLLIGKILEELTDFLSTLTEYSKTIDTQPSSLYSTNNFGNQSGVVENRLFSPVLANSFASLSPL
jgi:hypothetical protein